MFHMTNDSHLFRAADELGAEGATLTGNIWTRGNERWLPLYEAKMVQAYDHRAADVVLNTDNLHRAAQPQAISATERARADRYAHPQYWVRSDRLRGNPWEWALGFKEITAPTNMRTMIAAVMPGVAFGNKLPLLVPKVDTAAEAARLACQMGANLNALAFDFVLRQKLQGQTINLFILE